MPYLSIEKNSLKIAVARSIRQFSAEQWRPLEDEDFPFTDFCFLSALEESGCIGGDSGWSPHYVYVQNDQGELLGCLLLYVKTNSYGEYIFDWQWADAYLHHGLNYYPKIVSAIPFTPATGRKILVNRKVENQDLLMKNILASARGLAESIDASSIHHLFIAKSEADILAKSGYMIRNSFQFHWVNREYQDFEAYADSLIGKKRKSIAKERREAKQIGLDFVRLSGDEIEKKHAPIMHQFYRNTINKMNAIPYLNEAFFKLLFANMRDRILLCFALDRGTPVAGSISFFKGNKLFGRYWGCSGPLKNLHFELCYYQTIEFAIAHNIQLFEAGAQGPHKLQRGFLPTLTRSAHEIFHPGFRNAISQYISEEAKAIEQGIAEPKTPFKAPQVRH